MPKARTVWDSNFAGPVEHLGEVEVSAPVSLFHHAERQWTHRKQNRQLAVVERLGAFAWVWLGVS
jgi:hypothetical protein